MTSITELPNELTTELDLAGPEGSFRLLRQSDNQLFYGWKDLPNMLDDTIVTSIRRAVTAVVHALQNQGTVMCAGAGTSGRIAVATCNVYNKALAGMPGVVAGHRYFVPLIAGGDEVLIRPKENVEDQVDVAIEDITRAHTTKNVVYFGITCGFSAPYVAGQLQYCMDRSTKCVPILMGFNPVERARNVAIEGWDHTFADIATALYERSLTDPSRNILLNPVVGPEPLSGSTRMKGGSATKILLDTVLSLALNAFAGSAWPLSGSQVLDAALTEEEKTEAEALRIIHTYADCVQQMYEQAANVMPSVITRAGQSLREGAHVVYIASDRSAIACATDAAECVPTFGASPDDVRAVCREGWSVLLGNSEQSLSGARDITLMPELTEKDTAIVFIGASNSDSKNRGVLTGSSWELQMAQKAHSYGASVVLVTVNLASEFEELKQEYAGFAALTNQIINVVLPEWETGACVPSYGDLILKLLANAITTGAFVLAGKVFGNRMIDLRIANAKLYTRSIGIVSTIAKVDAALAEDCVLRAIYHLPNDRVVIDEHKAFVVSKHISTAKSREKVVPLAVLLAYGFETDAALSALASEPIIRALIARIQTKA